MTNGTSVKYAGVTSNLVKRATEHKEHLFPGSFTARYNSTKLVYYMEFEDIQTAIVREKQIKAGSGKDKLTLINRMNPKWEDLYHAICGL